MPEQSIAEILRRVRRIQIVARRSVNDLLAGQYRSVFRGRGMEFDEVREYQPGDEIRTIDWNVTARTGTPFVKRYSEEREMTVMFVLDVSASGVFGSGVQSKLERMAEIAAVLMFSAFRNNDKAGLLLFANDVVSYFPPRKGRSSLLRLIREMITTTPVRQETRPDLALQFLNRVQRRRCVVFLISDFLTLPSLRALSVSRGRHDVIAVSVSDPREQQFPDVGFIRLQDAETGELIELDTRHPRVRAALQQRWRRREDELKALLQRAGIDRLQISTHEAYAVGLRRFFETREKRFR